MQHFHLYETKIKWSIHLTLLIEERKLSLAHITHKQAVFKMFKRTLWEGKEGPHDQEHQGPLILKMPFALSAFSSLELITGSQQNLLQYQLCWESKPGPTTLPHIPNHSCHSFEGCSSSQAQVFILQDKRPLSLEFIAYFLVLLYMTEAFAQQSF